jgi:hypothetical protein
MKPYILTFGFAPRFLMRHGDVFEPAKHADGERGIDRKRQALRANLR